MGSTFKLSLLVGVFTCCCSYSQCLTDFYKLNPTPSFTSSAAFGDAISMDGNILAVGAPLSDSLDRISGIVYLYEKSNTDWNIIGVLKPQETFDGMRFGISVKVKGDYILVAASHNGGKVYVYRKPGTGWRTITETCILSTPSSYSFGVSGFGNSGTFDIADDYNTIVVGDEFYSESNAGVQGRVTVFKKGPLEEWTSSARAIHLDPPLADQVLNFGRVVKIHGRHIAVLSPYQSAASGAVIMYGPNPQNGDGYVIEATLMPGNEHETYWNHYADFAFTDHGVFAPVSYLEPAANPGATIVFFAKPSGDTWHDSNPTQIVPLSSFFESSSRNSAIVALTGNSNYLAITARNYDNGNASILNAAIDHNGNLNFTSIARHHDLEGNSVSSFGARLAANEYGDLAAGYFPHDESAASIIATNVFTKSGEQYIEQQIGPNEKSTQGFMFGSAILAVDDLMFVSAPYDANKTNNGGCVYGFKKNSGAWQPHTKILPLSGSGFGTSMAHSEGFMAIGAAGHGNGGKVYVYKSNDHWQSHILTQTIELPPALNVYTSGANLAMSGEWLVIPCVTMANGARMSLAFYKQESGQYIYKQFFEVGGASIFAREQVPSVDIEGSVLVAGNGFSEAIIFELVENDQWEPRHSLIPSDPEFAQIDPSFEFWITNGSMFGRSVEIDGNRIFISAPTKDYGGTWDVGAVYVYVKEPHELWRSTTETAKILPSHKEERELFGWSLKGFENTLLVGAPGSDYSKNGLPRNKPGKAYVFQTEDFFWQTAQQQLLFEGDSFVKDYFGINTTFDLTDFIISSTIEDGQKGDLAGSVYVTEIPKIIKLVPPICSTGETVDLFGYPFGGTWSGPGITDPVLGIFDPVIAGNGLHTISYLTPNCINPGILRIEVREGFQVSAMGETTRFICTEGNTSTVLALNTPQDVSHKWYYRAQDNMNFTFLDISTPTLSTTLPGQYQSRVSNNVCSVSSPIFTVAIEENPISINSIAPICDDSPVELKAVPAGGKWQGNRLNGSEFNPKNAFGNHIVDYEYLSFNNCVHRKSTSIVVATIYDIQYQRNGDICSDGSTLVSTDRSKTNENKNQYQWFEVRPDQSRVLLSSSGVVECNRNMSISANVSNAYCSKDLPSLELNDKFFITTNPSEGAVVCELDEPMFSAEIGDEDAIKFLFQSNESSTLDEVEKKIINGVAINGTGYYQIEVQRNNCTFYSDPVHIELIEADSLFVPNVFTPNGDGQNDLFMAMGNVEIVNLLVFNRYGITIFEGDARKGWSGEGTSPGVYYWTIVYQNCFGEVRSQKGFVHLIR